MGFATLNPSYALRSMWARKRIDIGWRDLLAAAGYALFPGSRAAAQQSAEQTWPGSDDVIASEDGSDGVRRFFSDLYRSVV